MGLTRLLQALPFQASQGRLRIPSAIQARCGVREEEVLRMEGTPALQQAVFELASNAKAHIAHAREQAKRERVGGDEVRVLLDVVPCERWLNALERCNFDVFDQGLHELERRGFEPLKLRYALWRHSRAATF